MEDAKPARIFYQLVKIGHTLATIGKGDGGRSDPFLSMACSKAEKIDSTDRWSVSGHTALIQKVKPTLL
jgi:hypothetical protein